MRAEKEVDPKGVAAEKPPVEEELTVIEISQEEAALLAKSVRRDASLQSVLSAAESSNLVNMIFVAHYQADATTQDKEAEMRYEAALELQWIEEWAAGHVQQAAVESGDEPSREAVRLLVKRSVLERVDLHRPLSYIIGTQPFYACTIKCHHPLLCPRPETEMWTNWYASYLSRASQPLRVLDMCCGTGCVGIAIAQHVPQAVVTAVDILPEAVQTSLANATLNRVPNERYCALQSDMFAYFGEPVAGNLPPATCTASAVSETRNDEGATHSPARKPPLRPKTRIVAPHIHSLDAIVSNPPYILPEEYVSLPRSITEWESKIALVGDDYREHHQHLYFQELCECGAAMLKPKRQRDPVLRDLPNLVIEVGLQAEVVAALVERSGLFDNVEVHLDYGQRPRWISANSIH